MQWMVRGRSKSLIWIKVNPARIAIMAGEAGKIAWVADVRGGSATVLERRIGTVNAFRSFLQEESGATAVEYGLIAALIAVAIVGVLTALGVDLVAIFDRASTELQGAMPD